MRRTTLTAILLAISLTSGVPMAAAGTADDPEIVDPADNQNPGFDITKAWFESSETGLKFTIEIVEQLGGAANRFTRVGFAIDGQEFRGIIGWDGDGRVRTHGMKGVIQLDTPALERWVTDNLVDVDIRYGAPARFAATIPWGMFDELAPDVVLDNLAASVSFYSPGSQRWNRAEYAESDRTYTVESPAGRAAILPGSPIGTIALTAFVLTAGIVGIAWWRASRAPIQKGPAPPRPTVAEPPPTTGDPPRIRIDPRNPE